MSEPNPYAPPSIAEPEAPTTRYWRVDGIDLLARNGATLPKVDLETGSTHGELKSIPRVHQTVSAMSFASALIFMAFFFVLNRYLPLDQNDFLICIVIGSVILSRLQALRGTTSGRVMIWTFIEEHRAKRAILRRRLRIVTMILTAACLMILSFRLFSLIDNHVMWMLRLFIVALILVLGLAIWAVYDRPKFKIHAASPGWLRITPIHPEALACLRSIEQEQLATDNPEGRKRLVRTVFYHRFPLRMLIGHNFRNPLILIRVPLMKLLRSRLLVREAYHFSEADEIPLEKICPPLRQAVESWLRDHPDWTFILGERLPSPAGDLIVENAILASPGLEHCVRINRAWMEQKPETGFTHFTFITWLEDGTHASTHDQPYLALKHPHLHHRASGPPERVFGAHLKHLSGLAIDPSSDIPELHARILREKEETDRLLTEMGLQSEVREAH